MGIFAANVRSLRKNAGLSQQQLAQRVGVGATTIGNIESEYLTAPAPWLLEALAKTFNTDVNGLLNRISPDVGERAKMVHIVHSVSSEKPFLEIDKIVETVFIDRDQLRGYEYMGIKMPDNSMIDEHICKDASVIVRQNAPIKNGDIVLAVYNNCDGVVRKYYSNGEETVLSAASGTGLYPDVRLNPEKDRLVILGKVVRWINAPVE